MIIFSMQGYFQCWQDIIIQIMNSWHTRYTVYNTRDTISYISENSTFIFIPGTLKAGISLEGRINLLSVLITYALNGRNQKFRDQMVMQQIQDHSGSGLNIFLINIQITVSLRDWSTVLAHILEIIILIINDEQIKEYGASFGIGVPMRRTYSRTNFLRLHQEEWFR